MPDGPRWRVPPDAALHWRHWDNEHILFHEQSGDTHRLNSLSARAIELLSTEPLTTSGLAGRLASELAESAPPGFAESIDSLVADFVALGLVTAVPTDDRQ